MQISLWSQKFIIVVKASQKFMLLLQFEVQSLFQSRIHHHQPVIKLLFLLFPSFFCIIIKGLKLPLTQTSTPHPHLPCSQIQKPHSRHSRVLSPQITHTQHRQHHSTLPIINRCHKTLRSITKPLPQLQLEHHTSRQQPTQAYTMDEPSQHFTRTLTEVPRQSKKETGEKRETEREFGFGLKPERSSPTSKVTPIVQSPPKFQADSH